MRNALGATMVAMAMLTAACGGGEPENVDVPQASQACDDAFAAAAIEPTGAASTDESETPEGSQAEQGEMEAEPARLTALEDTMTACESEDEWMGGARNNPNAFPQSMDRETALDLLCEAYGQESPVCANVLEADSEGARTGDEAVEQSD